MEANGKSDGALREHSPSLTALRVARCCTLAALACAFAAGALDGWASIAVGGPGALSGMVALVASSNLARERDASERRARADALRRAVDRRRFRSQGWRAPRSIGDLG